MGKFLHLPSKDAASALNVNLTLPAASSSLPVPQLCSRFHPCWTTASHGSTLGTHGAGDWQVAETRTQSGHLQAPRLSNVSVGMGAASLGASLTAPCSCLHASCTQVPPAQSWWDPHCCCPALTRRGAPRGRGQDHEACRRPQQQPCPHCGVQVPCSPAPSLLPAAHRTGSPQGSE